MDRQTKKNSFHNCEHLCIILMVAPKQIEQIISILREAWGEGWRGVGDGVARHGGRERNQFIFFSLSLNLYIFILLYLDICLS